MRQHATVTFSSPLTPDQAERRMTMLETFNFRAMVNAQLFALQMERIGVLARLANTPAVSNADLAGIVGTVADLATKGQVDAELDSKCMNYTLSLGPDEIEEFEQLMETGELHATQH
jgi:hypothetical protein